MSDIHTEEIQEFPFHSRYEELIATIDINPYAHGLLEQIVELAHDEENAPHENRGFYDTVPLEEMAEVAKLLNDASDLEAKYHILAKQASMGLLWYDIVLGHVNDKSLEAIESAVSGKSWKRGLDIGTGPGNSLRYLTDHCRFSVGIDKEQFLLHTASATVDHTVSSTAVARATELPFEQHSFGIVISNGLTHYIPDEDIRRYSQEVARVLQPGGSYFESFVMGNDDEVLATVEQEYRTSAKGVLACLMDRLVTWNDEPSDKSPSKFQLLTRQLQQAGLDMSKYTDQERNVLILEFTKPYPKQLENIRREFFSGDTYEASSAAFYFLYEDAALDMSMSGKINIDALPEKKKYLQRLREFSYLSDDAQVIDWNTGDYISVFVDTLINTSVYAQVDPDIRMPTVALLVNNLYHLEQELLSFGNTQHWQYTEAISYLKILRNQCEGKQWMSEVVTLVNKIVAVDN